MKKFLFFIVLGIATIQFVNAQVIDVDGKGILNDDNPALTIPNMETVEKVVVEAAAFFMDAVTVSTFKVPANVTFSSGAIAKEAEFQNVDEEKSDATYDNMYYYLYDAVVMSLGYYTATFNKAEISGGTISLDKNGQGNSILSFYAYIYRTDGTVNKYSLISKERAYIFWNPEDPMVYEFDLPVVQTERNIKVTIPLSNEVAKGTADADWVSVLYFVQGEQVLPSETFDINALGTNFLAKTLELNNVPGNVTKIKVAIYSPRKGVDTKTGESSIIGLPVLTVENLVPGCTRAIGYWKTHSKYGPAKPADPIWNLIGPDKKFYKSGQSYIKVLQTSPKGNKYYILAHQYIAAELNFLAGANISAVEVEFQQAKKLFESYSPDFYKKLSKKESEGLEKIFTKLAEKLDKYNNGIIGPGNCDEESEKDKDKDRDKDYGKDDDDRDKDKDKDDKDKKSGKIKVQVNPNPVNSNTSISFTPACDGNAMVELFDSMGNKKARLYNQKVKKDSPVKFNFNGTQYRDGLYVVVFTNGSVQESVTIKINK